MNTDEAIETVVCLAEAFLNVSSMVPTITNHALPEGKSKLKKIKEAINIVNGLKPSNIVDEVFNKEKTQRSKRRLQLCGKHEDPNNYIPFPDEIDGKKINLAHPD